MGHFSETAAPRSSCADSPRDAALDLLKWLAMAAMLLDHLRLLWPALAWTYIPGRLAFPGFCLALAANLARTRAQPLALPRLARYLGGLLLFAVLSEPAYRLFMPQAHSLNVLPTLALGLLLALGVQRSGWPRAIALLALILSILLHERLMFGLPGVLLPAACLLALEARRWLWLPCALSLAANLGASMQALLLQGDGLAWLGIGVAGAAPWLGCRLLATAHRLRIYPMRRWAYLLYPGHLLVYAALAG